MADRRAARIAAICPGLIEVVKQSPRGRQRGNSSAGAVSNGAQLFVFQWLT
jgi:hypothetical protein